MLYSTYILCPWFTLMYSVRYKKLKRVKKYDPIAWFGTGCRGFVTADVLMKGLSGEAIATRWKLGEVGRNQGT